MTPNDQRIAIATALGWTEIEYARNGIFLFGIDPEDGERRGIPKYHEDLNAMHVAEECLSPEQREAYVATLWRSGTIAGAVLALAERRAEALLRTIGKWIE